MVRSMIAGGAKAVPTGHRGQGSGGRSTGGTPSSTNMRPDSSFSRHGSKSLYGGSWSHQQQRGEKEDNDEEDLYGDIPKVVIDEEEDEEEEDDEEDWEDVDGVKDANDLRSVHVDGSSSSSSAMFVNNLDMGNRTQRPPNHPVARDGRGKALPGSTTSQSRHLQTQVQQVMDGFLFFLLILNHIILSNHNICLSNHAPSLLSIVTIYHHHLVHHHHYNHFNTAGWSYSFPAISIPHVIIWFFIEVFHRCCSQHPQPQSQRWDIEKRLVCLRRNDLTRTSAYRHVCRHRKRSVERWLRR